MYSPMIALAGLPMGGSFPMSQRPSLGPMILAATKAINYKNFKKYREPYAKQVQHLHLRNNKLLGHKDIFFNSLSYCLLLSASKPQN